MALDLEYLGLCWEALDSDILKCRGGETQYLLSQYVKACTTLERETHDSKVKNTSNAEMVSAICFQLLSIFSPRKHLVGKDYV